VDVVEVLGRLGVNSSAVQCRLGSRGRRATRRRRRRWSGWGRAEAPEPPAHGPPPLSRRAAAAAAAPPCVRGRGAPGECACTRAMRPCLQAGRQQAHTRLHQQTRACTVHPCAHARTRATHLTAH
jgi:hypothetical protein